MPTFSEDRLGALKSEYELAAREPSNLRYGYVGLPDRGLGFCPSEDSAAKRDRRPRGRRISFEVSQIGAEPGTFHAARIRRAAARQVTPSSRPISSRISTIPEFQHGRAGEFHFATGVGRQRSDEEIAERRPGMGSAAFPSADDVIAFRKQVRGAPKSRSGERFPKVRHKRLDVFSATARFVKRILQPHVGCSEFIDNSEVAGLAPEIREPAANDSLVIFFL